MGPKNRQRQSRLTFNPLPSSSSPASSNRDAHFPARPANVRTDGTASPAKRRRVTDTSTSAATAPSHLNPSFPPTPDLTAPAQASSAEDGEPRKPSQRASSHKKKLKQKKLELASSPIRNSKGGANMTGPVKSQSTRTASQPTPKIGFFGTQQRAASDSSSEELSSEEEMPTVSRSQKKAAHTTTKQEVSSRPASNTKDEEDDSDDAMPTTPATLRSRKSSRVEKAKETTGNSSPFVVDDDEDDSDDVVITGSKRKRTSRSQVSSDDEEDMPSRSRRKKLRPMKPLRPITEEEREDLENDMKDLASSGSDDDVRLAAKIKKPTKRSAREEALAALRRKRAGAIDITENDNDNDGGEEEDQSEQEEFNELDESDDVYEDEEVAALPPRQARRDMFNHDEHDEGFVVEDDEEPLGVPEDVPIEFTRYASMKPKQLFKYVVEWMVHKKINPAFDSTNELYVLAFKKLDDQVQGLAGSKFRSAAWTSDFTLALQARPELNISPIDRGSGEHFMRDKCDACNRSGHPATFEINFAGKPYHPDTLDEVDRPRRESDSSDDEAASDSDSASTASSGADNYDHNGRQIPHTDTTFYVGKFCMANAEKAHALQHWRWNLYEWVVQYLGNIGYLAPEKIVKRDKWSTRKREKYANKIVDAMEGDGKIEALYKDFKNNVDNAVNSMQARFGGSP